MPPNWVEDDAPLDVRTAEVRLPTQRRGETTRHTFETYEQARQHADDEVARGRERVGAVVFALRRGEPRDSSFVPGEVREQSRSRTPRGNRRRSGLSTRPTPQSPRRDSSRLHALYNDQATTKYGHQDEEASSDHRRRHRCCRSGVGDQVNAALAQPSSAGTAPSFHEPVQRSRIVAAPNLERGGAKTARLDVVSGSGDRDESLGHVGECAMGALTSDRHL